MNMHFDYTALFLGGIPTLYETLIEILRMKHSEHTYNKLLLISKQHVGQEAIQGL